jgi:hypothetical protein
MSLSVWDFAWILLALAAAVAFGAYFFSKTRIEPRGIVRANDVTDEKLRQAVIRAVKGVDVASMPREQAERHLEELSRHATAREYAEIYAQPVEVTETWPDARCIISGNIAVIDLWVGHRIVGDREGIKPIQVEVNRQATLNLQTKRPLKAAWEDITSPPKRSEPVAPRLKVAANASARPAEVPKARKLPAKATLKKP